MDLQFTFCYAVITVFCMVFSILIAVKVNSDIGSEREVLYFRWIVWAHIVFCVTDTVWCFGNFGVVAIPNWAMYVLSGVSTEALGVCCFFWFCYGETRLGNRSLGRRAVFLCALSPLIIMGVLYTTTYWTHLMFYYGAESSYRMQQGPLYAGSIGLMAIYIFAVSIHSAVRAAREQSLALKRQYLSFVAFAVVPTVAGFFDPFVPFMPVIAPSLFTSIFFVFLTLQESQIFNDGLTGLNNRRRADEVIRTQVAQSSPENPVYVFMIDVNSFKLINDRFGHLEGDRALVAVARAIQRACDETHSFAARWGGDEFVVVADGRSIGSPEALIGELHAQMELGRVSLELGYPLGISVGAACCVDPDMAVADIIAEADARLYENKHALHGQESKGAAA